MWHIKYWAKGNNNPIKKWFLKLPYEQSNSVSKEVALLKNLGNKLMLPHSRALGKSLFELRERRFGLRIYYCFYGENIIILLASGAKESQINDIKIARERIKDLKVE